jgi:hypothetical protein
VSTNFSYFQSAVREMSQRPEATLYHGFLCPDFGVGRPRITWDPSSAMAWVGDGNVVIMRGTGEGQIVWSREEFKAVFQPRFIKSYDHAQAGKSRRSSGTDGPWDDTLLDHLMLRGVLTKRKVTGEQKERQTALRGLLLRKKMDKRSNVR